MGKKRLGTFRREPWNGKATKRPMDWQTTLARFEESKARRRVFNLSSPGVAQVTRVRLLDAFETDVVMKTERNRLVWEKPASR